MAICQRLSKAFCKTWHSLPFLKACLIKAAPLIFVLGKQKLNRMKSNGSPSLLQYWLRKVLSNQINSVNKCLSDKLSSVPAGNIPLPSPQVSLFAAPWRQCFAHGHRASGWRTMSRLPAPFILYCDTGAERKKAARELAQFPEMSGSLGRARHLRAGTRPTPAPAPAATAGVTGE